MSSISIYKPDMAAYFRLGRFLPTNAMLNVFLVITVLISWICTGKPIAYDLLYCEYQ